MSALADITRAVEGYDRSVEANVTRATKDKRFRTELQRRMREVREKIPTATTPTGLTLPQGAVPQTDEPSEIARYLYSQGLPGEFPFVNGVYPAMYQHSTNGEEPTRLFAGLGLAEDTNARFHYLTGHQ